MDNHLAYFCAWELKWLGGERLFSHPIVEFVFAEIASTSQTIRTSFLTMFALVRSSGRFLPAKTHILFVVELDLAEMACVSRNVRTTRSESLPAFRSNVPFLSARSRILLVELAKAETQAFRG